MVRDPLVERIETLIAPQMAAMGYDLVRVQLSGTKRRTLQVMAERRDGNGMTVEDCADISHAVSAVLDVEDPIAGGYTLEVSSPGIDRPLVRPDDFARFAGHDAKIELDAALHGRRRLQGRLLGVDGDEVRLALDDGEVGVPFARIHRAKLVLTDKLVRETSQSNSNA